MPAQRARPVTWPEAAPIVDRLGDALPVPFREIPRAERPERWTAWLNAQRQALTARMIQGEVDSIVNLLLFGTSFTKEPRITAKLLKDLDQRWKAGDRSVEATLARQYQQRAADLIAAAANPHAAERMITVRQVLAEHGHDLRTAAGRQTATEYLFTNLARVGEEAAKFVSQLEAARRASDATTALAERSRIFRDRGLAADSSVLTQFAVDRALCELAARGLPNGPIHRVAIVGPGLDFADKQEGFDFYEPQSLQPFTLPDSLLRCGLAKDGGVSVTTLDVSPRVSAHLRGAVERARLGRSYRLVLPWNEGEGWLPSALDYWKRAGERVGKPFPVLAPGELPGVKARGVAVAPGTVRAVRPLTASIVSERVDLPADERFDLVVATNVLVYYDTFEQTLALANIAAMLRPGGVLLTNDAVLEIPEVPMRSEGSLAVPFSSREGDGERMIWYVRMSR